MYIKLYRALEAACAAYASLNLSLLHYITLQTLHQSATELTREYGKDMW